MARVVPNHFVFPTLLPWFCDLQVIVHFWPYQEALNGDYFFSRLLEGKSLFGKGHFPVDGTYFWKGVNNHRQLLRFEGMSLKAGWVGVEWKPQTFQEL